MALLSQGQGAPRIARRAEPPARDVGRALPSASEAGAHPSRVPHSVRCIAKLIRSGLVLVLLSSLLWDRCGILAQVSREYDVKAVFLLNLAQFVEWPAEAFGRTDSPLHIGVLGVDPFSRTLDDVLEGETVRGRPVRPKRFRRVEDVEDCHILFISASEERRATEILTALRNRPILTVSDMDAFVSRGGMIKLYTTEEEKVRLRINLDAARTARLTISAKLLRVAQTVGSSPPD